MSDEIMSDEEKSYYEWFKKNIQYVNKHKESIHIMKKIYIDGFAAGWSHKQQYSAQEYLQK
jgi:hypothetical protein